MRFAHPLALLLSLAPLGVLGLRYLLRRRYWGHSAGHVWTDPRFQSWPWHYLPDVFMVLSMAALAVALADPRLERRVTTAENEGRAIVIVLDLSFSMQERMGPPPPAGRSVAADTRPTRMEVIKNALKDFVALRRNDRIGLVVFSENAYVISPLTTDYEYLAHYIDLINAETLSGEGYTAIGEGVAAALMLLDFQGVRDGRRGILLVFTDGENNFGRDPIGMVIGMKDEGHRGYLIGLDLPEYVTQREQSRRLVEAFNSTGGRYYNADGVAALEQAYRDISVVETASLNLGTRTEEIRVFHLAIVASLIFLGIALALRTIPRLSEP